MFGVVPKEDCPHHANLNLSSIKDKLNYETITSVCSKCQDGSENWLCLECDSTFCSRFVNSHMSEHFAEVGHSIALSLTDASFWCYSCDSYVNSHDLRSIGVRLGEIKYPNTQSIADVERELFSHGSSSSSSVSAQPPRDVLDQIKAAFEDEVVAPRPVFSREDLVAGLRAKSSKKLRL